jgi:hypothetical protein
MQQKMDPSVQALTKWVKQTDQTQQCLAFCFIYFLYFLD